MRDDPSSHDGRSGRGRFLEAVVGSVVGPGIVTTDPEGVIASWNDGARRITGYTAAELVEDHVSVLASDDTRERDFPRNALDTAATRGRAVDGYWISRSDGTKTWVRVEIVPVRDGGSLRGFGLVLDEPIGRTEAGATPDLSTGRVPKHPPESGILLFDRCLRFRAADGLEAWDLPRTQIVDRRVRDLLAPGQHDGSEPPERGFEGTPDRASGQEAESAFRHTFEGKGTVIESELGDRRVRVRTVPVETAGGTVGAGLALVQDVTDEYEWVQEARHYKRALETCDRINRITETVIRELSAPTTRDEIEETVCAHLAETDSYTSATIVERIQAGNRFAPRTWAGIDEEYFEAITDDDSAALRDERVGDALRSGESHVVQHIDRRPWIPEVMREELVERGISSVAVLPLPHGETIHGALVVRSGRPEAFGERERRALETLGRTVGFAITAVRHQSLLLSDTVVEIELRVPAPEGFFADVSRRFDCTCIHEGSVPIEDGEVLHYVRIDGASADPIIESAEDAETVEAIRAVSEYEDGCRLEVVIDASPTEILLEAGATLRGITAEEGTTTVVAEVPTDVSVRSVVDAFRSRYPGTELVSRREIAPTGGVTGIDRVLAELTEKQRRALRTAYLAGYYQHPRESTAQEVAETLGIADSTLHQHLRAAQGKILRALFGPEP